jgi:myo-inositol catabolism protein IolS
MMQFRKLGCTGYDVSTVGFGTWQIGGERWHVNSENERIHLLQEANDLGVNIFDVAVVYGQYVNNEGQLQSRSQELLGKAFAKRREKVIYCVKLGQYDEYSHRHNYNPQRIVHQFQQSLRRLQTDFIDICLIHAPSIFEVNKERAITILQTLQALGYVKFIGYSFEAEPEHAAIAITQPIDVMMLQYNLIEQDCSDVIEQGRLKGIGVLVGGIFKRGYLTGQYRHIEDLPLENDYWRWNLNLNKGKVESLLMRSNQFLEQYQSPEMLRKACIQFVLNQPNAASCIIGHQTVREVIENIQSAYIRE